MTHGGLAVPIANGIKVALSRKYRGVPERQIGASVVLAARNFLAARPEYLPVGEQSRGRQVAAARSRRSNRALRERYRYVGGKFRPEKKIDRSGLS